MCSIARVAADQSLNFKFNFYFILNLNYDQITNIRSPPNSGTIISKSKKKSRKHEMTFGHCGLISMVLVLGPRTVR